ncbi:MAG TPA: zinc-binding alcohol dehydrogenase family protein [Tepidisphaeraceae bacterium]|jgi:NADPH:quinone reductase-like Zn-dependent oxidoreductase|nr:zinc-binding alcohol dehydrogenase family protein [Tepidisphaeraceae bacterium]
MKALRFSAFGEPAVLSLVEVPTPEPGPREALVRVAAGGINPSDVKNVAGHFKQTTLPRTPGRDFAGTVVRGEKFQGQAVWGTVSGLGITRDGAHAEYVVVPNDGLALKPSSLSMPQAAAIGVPYVTAWSTIIDTAQLQPGETLLIVGARGAVGRAATQIANWKNARVIAADTSSDPLPGALAVINTRTEDLPARVHELTDGRGAQVVLDAVGGPMFEPSLRCLAKRGRQVAITNTGERRVSFDLIDFYHNQSRLLGFDSVGLSDPDIAAILDRLRIGFEAGALTAPEIETTPLEDAIDAYRKIAEKRSAKKQVLVMGQQ